MQDQIVACHEDQQAIHRALAHPFRDQDLSLDLPAAVPDVVLGAFLHLLEVHVQSCHLCFG